MSIGRPVATETWWASYRSWNQAMPPDSIRPVMGVHRRALQAHDITSETKISCRSTEDVPIRVMDFRSRVCRRRKVAAGGPSCAQKTPAT